MTDTIRELRELLDKATERPWVPERLPRNPDPSLAAPESEHNIALTIAAVNALPALLDIAEAAGDDAAGMPVEMLLRDAASVLGDGPLRDRLLIKADDFQVADLALARPRETK